MKFILPRSEKKQRCQKALGALGGAALLWVVAAQAASASGVNGVEVATSTVQKIVDLLTGELATVAFLLIIVLGGVAWWITRTSRAGEIIGRTIVGAVIIFGAVQISEYFAFQGASL